MFRSHLEQLSKTSCEHMRDWFEVLSISENYFTLSLYTSAGSQRIILFQTTIIRVRDHMRKIQDIFV